MNLINRVNNVYLIDTNMLGFEHYMSVYLVEGKELALIDTGLPTQLEQVRAGIKDHGFSISDISYIFITHAEHPDHGGNAGPLLRESPRAKVYIHPLGDEYLTHPEIEEARRKATVEAGKREPVPQARIQYVNDGDIFDLGNGQKLRIIFTPGHQPSGIVILDERNKGLFINDLAGNYFSDADALYPLNPVRSDNRQAIESLNKLVNLPLTYLYLCHYGISDKPKQIMSRAINNMQMLLDIGTKYMREGRPELIANKVYETFLPELEKIRSVRGEAEYAYASQKLGPHQANLFAKFCQEHLQI